MEVTLWEKPLVNNRKSLYLYYAVNGDRQYECLGLYLDKNKVQNKETMALAENIRAKRQLELQHLEHGFIPTFKKKLNFVEYFEKQANNRTTGKGNWLSCLKHLKEFTGGNIRFAGVDGEWLVLLQQYLMTKVTSNTAGGYYSYIKCALRQAVKDKIIPSNPAHDVANIKSTDSDKDFLTEEEIQKLADTPCRYPQVKRAFLFSCQTGLRLSDVENLRWQNIQNGKVQFRQQKTKAILYVTLTETAKELLYNYLGNVLQMPTNSIFDLPSRMQIIYVLREWVKAAEIDKKVSFHTSRHSFATIGLTNGIDLYVMSKMLGHKTIAATQIYARVVDQRTEEAATKMPPIRLNRQQI